MGPLKVRRRQDKNGSGDKDGAQKCDVGLTELSCVKFLDFEIPEQENTVMTITGQSGQT
jgi:hypothetical protein